MKKLDRIGAAHEGAIQKVTLHARNSWLLIPIFAALVACGGDPGSGSEAVDASKAMVIVEDPHSFGNPQQVRVTHVALDLDVDFDAKALRGSATLDLEIADPDARALVLDTRDLHVAGVHDVSDGTALEFSFGDADADLGTPLTIALRDGTRKVRIDYTTDPGATALQWLSARQTTGGHHPFLFSQGQAIHTRSWIPLQDSPGVRITYEAVLRVPVGMRAVMSAENDPKAPLEGEFHFDMPQAVPPYLIALGVGDLSFQEMGARTAVYAEATVVAAAANEFADTERMMEVTEALYGPYLWDRYDLLILPPSFPFGGMENPRLSFITPTVIAGDRSLVALIAHELAHSWSGNLVSNSTWRDLWLNEGFTTYLTNRIMEEVFGERRALMEAALAHRELVAAMAELTPAAQILAIDLRGQHADDVFTRVPYVKGMFFLRWLENAFGRELFDPFLRSYFDAFAFESITTEQFEAYLTKHLLDAHPGKVTAEQVRVWIHEPGLPDTLIVPQSDAFARIDAVRERWQAGAVAAGAVDTAGWTVHEWRHFLGGLPQQLDAARMRELDAAFDLTNSRNYVVARDWLVIAVRNQYRSAYPRLEAFLKETGRMFLVVPLYKELMATGQAEFARRVYAEAKPGYHPIAIAAVDPFIKGEPE